MLTEEIQKQKITYHVILHIYMKYPEEVISRDQRRSFAGAGLGIDCKKAQKSGRRRESQGDEGDKNVLKVDCGDI